MIHQEVDKDGENDSAGDCGDEVSDSDKYERRWSGVSFVVFSSLTDLSENKEQLDD